MNRRIDVITTGEAPACPSCGRDALLWARVPHGWTNTAGERVEGFGGVVLCSECDARVPHAAPLITWFHVNGRADDEDEEFVRLLVAWAAGVLMPELEVESLEDEIERWRQGNL